MRVISAPRQLSGGANEAGCTQLHFENHEVAELIGLELATLIVDTCYPELLREREETERVMKRQTPKSPYRR